MRLITCESPKFALPNAEVDTPLNRASSNWTVRFCEVAGCFIVEDDSIGLIGYVSLEKDVAVDLGLQ